MMFEWRIQFHLEQIHDLLGKKFTSWETVLSQGLGLMETVPYELDATWFQIKLSMSSSTSQEKMLYDSLENYAILPSLNLNMKGS